MVKKVMDFLKKNMLALLILLVAVVLVIYYVVPKLIKKNNKVNTDVVEDKAEMDKVVDGLDQQRDLIFNQVKAMILNKKLRTLKGEKFTGEFNQRLPVAFNYEQKMILIDRGIQ